ncbi:gluconate 2-dehydrogenase gamma chain [Arboricoccus pini]|uniref:Gluconate 2-dehydrogenase gamma chain n=1 Tax=Arboricoccus pini TaxID=1963835 RepID=A0A212R0R0_9PROT|nr:gluconate 2-dehydrogenase subunit 3 family protein [Arboricoccus pini]SNB65570.1 gluconate 2-dehydrogenase gamma chain [Arboricoccus pini]
MKRREALLSLGAAVAAAPAVSADTARAEVVRNYPQDMALDRAFQPPSVRVGGPLTVLTDDSERRTIGAIFDRLIPADEFGPSATEAGCIEFLDAQLAGPFGQGAALYREGPRAPDEDKMVQKAQFIATPRERYATGLKALDAWATNKHGAPFADLEAARQDEILAGMENGDIELAPEVNTKAFFELMLQNVREGYFSDPIYGGNKNMAGWKMIGFPGARYDYRLYADRTGQKLDLEPVNLIPKD